MSMVVNHNLTSFMSPVSAVYSYLKERAIAAAILDCRAETICRLIYQSIDKKKKNWQPFSETVNHLSHFWGKSAKHSLFQTSQM